MNKQKKVEAEDDLAFVHYCSTEESASTKNVLMTTEALSKQCNTFLFSTLQQDKVISFFDINKYFELYKNGFGVSKKPLQVIDRLVFSFLTLFQIWIRDIERIYTRDIVFLAILNLIPFDKFEIIYEAHNPYDKTSIFPEILEKPAVKSADHTFCVSEGVEKDLSRWTDSTSILRNCVRWTDFEDLKNLDSGNETLVLYSGSLKPRKGVDSLIDAFEQLGEDYKLKILGSSGSKSLLKRIEGHEKIENPGFVSNEKILENLSRADILVHPSKDTFYQRKYTSPMKIFEYMASGTPVISSDLPTSRWIDEEHIHYFSPEKYDELSDSIREISKDPSAEKEALEAREKVKENHTYESKASKIIAQFSKLANT